jgi:mannan endo-1,4-beta-mannosidase
MRVFPPPCTASPRARLAALGVAAATFLQAAIASAEPAAGTSARARPLGESVLFGVYAPGVPYDDTAFQELESKTLGAHVDLASGFIDWDYVLGEARDAKLADGGRRTLLYSWEPHCRKNGDCVAFRDVIAGRTDAYLERVAASMRLFPHDIHVRPWAEMNAHWSPYQPTSGRRRAGTVDEFKRAWRYLHDFFRVRGVKNIKFVFSPDVSDEPGDIPLRDLWPGSDPRDGHGYVDVLGVDGYNWGESGTAGGTRWQEFDDLFRRAYAQLTALDPALPVWICEFGSKEPAKSDGTPRAPAPVDPHHSKGAWFERMFASTAFPRLRALAYYSSYQPGYDNQRDFRVESSPESLRVIRAFVKARAAARE